MKKILVVDDSITARLQLKNIFEEHQFVVVEAQDGIDGIDKLNGNADIGLLIVDLNMPDMDGITMCKKIRENEKFRSIPIFIISTESVTEVREKAKQVGITVWLVKPVKADPLIKLVKKVLNDQ